MFKQKPKLVRILVIVIILLLGIGAGVIYFKNKQIDKYKNEYKREVLKNDTLTKVSEGHYKKLVADTLTKRELRKEIADLKIKAENPLIVYKTVLQPVEVEKPIDSVSVEGSKVSITDFYPEKNSWFIKYEANLDIDSLATVSNSKFSFSPLPIDIVVSEKERGIFQADIKSESFIQVNSLEVKSLPLEQKRPDNFGFLAGGGVNKNFTDQSINMELAAGIRIKKTNFLITANTDGQAGAKILFEF